MWKIFSFDYIRHNRASCISIAVSALIASFFIALVSGTFYNMWADENRRIAAEEGDWQGRLQGGLGQEALAVARSFANVERAELTGGGERGTAVIHLWFHRPRRAYEDTDQIAGLIGRQGAGNVSDVRYNGRLLSQYFIFSPEERKAPPRLLFVYLCFLAAVCVSLAMMIHSAFTVTMESRMRQLGILKSIGATPAQIRAFLLQEALALCLGPILAGIPLGAGACNVFVRAADGVGRRLGISRAVGMVWSFPLAVTGLSFAVCLFTVWISAWLPARRLGRLAPLEAVRGDGETGTGKMRRFRWAKALFGVEGELARKSLYARRRAYRTAGISLTLACFVFSAFLNFEVMSYMHTYHTFFQRYRDTWDLLLILEPGAGGAPEAVSRLEGISGCTEYRKYQAYARLPEDMVSRELEALGGPLGLEDTGILKEGDAYLVPAPLLVLDDQSFAGYCREQGVSPADGGQGLPVVAVNRIWDNVNSRFKDRKYIPYLEETEGMRLEMVLPGGEAEEMRPEMSSPGGEAEGAMDSRRTMDSGAARTGAAGPPATAHILACAQQPPDLREEFADFALVLVAPESGFQAVQGSFPPAETYFNIRTDSDQEIPAVQRRIEGLLEGRSGWELENRLSEEAFNEAVRTGYKLVMGGLCTVLALIGLANVFANALGSVSQRRREFARYLSAGMTPGSVRRVLALEALWVGGKPVAVSLLLNILFVAYCLHESLIEPEEFLAFMPVMPIGAFALFVLLAVGLSYWIGGRRILKGNLIGMLRDDTQI